jgi:hypothetical protein
MSMPWLWILLILLLGGVALLALLIFSEWRWRLVSPIARGAANRIGDDLARAEGWFSPPQRIDPAGFLLGLGLLVLMIWAIVRQYLPLYGEAVAVVTGLEAEKSAGLAFFMVLLTGLAGVLLELTSGSAVLGEGRQAVRIVLSVFLSLGLIILMSFEGLFYYTFLRKTAGGLVPALGGIAFFLIAFVEAIAFFFITRLTLAPAGAMTVRLLRAPVVVTGLTLRLSERFFDSLPKRRKRKPEAEEAEESNQEEKTP